MHECQTYRDKRQIYPNKAGNVNEGQSVSQALVYHEKHGRERYSDQWNSRNYRRTCYGIIRNEGIFSHAKIAEVFTAFLSVLERLYRASVLICSMPLKRLAHPSRVRKRANSVSTERMGVQPCLEIQTWLQVKFSSPRRER